jgi:hypothetical protein
MLALGGVLSCAALLALTALALVFRRPNPPRWTMYSRADELVAIAIVCALAMGIDYLAAGVISAREEGPDPIDIGLLAAVLIVSFMLWRRLNFFARARALDAEAEATGRARLPAAEGAPDLPNQGVLSQGALAPPEPQPPKPTHRAA